MPDTRNDPFWLAVLSPDMQQHLRDLVPVTPGSEFTCPRYDTVTPIIPLMMRMIEAVTELTLELRTQRQ